MKKRILILEDEVDVAQAIGRKLEHADYEPVMATDGERGLAIAHSQKVDLIMTDVVMPGMDGFVFCQKLKESGEFAGIPVIVFSAYANEEGHFRDLGVDDFLKKPFDAPTLLESVDRIFARLAKGPKGKKILVQDGQEAGIQMALRQFSELGFTAQVKIVQESQDIIEESCRNLPDVIVLDMRQERVPAYKTIESLRKFVILRDKIILVYANDLPEGHEKKDRRKDDTEKIKQLCLDAGATKCIGALNRESFLSILFEYCRM